MSTSESREPGPDASVEDVQADIEDTRQQLGQTVEALSAKLDVKGQAKHKAADAKKRVATRVEDAKNQVVATVTDDEGSLKPGVPVAAAAAGVALFVGGAMTRRRRHRGAPD